MNNIYTFMERIMKLLRFKVRQFRSVSDSGWISTTDVTTLIGVNESGKSNLLIPLWKLNPAKGGEIKPVEDMPRAEYNRLRNLDEKPIFIEAEFELPSNLKTTIASKTKAPLEELSVVRVGRDYDANLFVTFPESAAETTVSRADVERIIFDAIQAIEAAQVAEGADDLLKKAALEVLAACLKTVQEGVEELGQKPLSTIDKKLKIDTSKAPEESLVAPLIKRVAKQIAILFSKVSRPRPENVEGVNDLVIAQMPKFVFYSNYGNLDSEIYLPHVIDNLERTNLGSKEEAKARTLKVLFEFVNLQPREILDLGKDLPSGAPGPARDISIAEVAANKKKRDILLQSASSELTKSFRDWWRQGDYKFRFAADGDHFRIWVSDDRRPEEIELEGRSTGLQWFLSFYLVFLVESWGQHENAVLLLDEPGLTLHPLAQRDLSAFFDSLSTTNQIMYTTHSPFLVDSDHLDRVRVVYVNDSGRTVASQDLRADRGNAALGKSVFAVHAALGLTVSDVLLNGCQPVIVEGPSDQLVLIAIRDYLIARGLIRPAREVIFVPAGGVRGVGSLVSILGGKEGDLPFVLLDSDKSGLEFAKALKDKTYAAAQEKVVHVGDAAGLLGVEIEDLIPKPLVVSILERYLKGAEDDFGEVFDQGKPLVNQVEVFAKAQKVKLDPTWKVEVARLVKARMPKLAEGEGIGKTMEGVWIDLFRRLNLA